MAQTEKARKVEQNQFKEALSEALAPIQTSLIELQQKYQELEKPKQEDKTPSPEEEMDRILTDIGDAEKFDMLSNKQLVDVMASAFDAALKANTAQMSESVMEAIKPDLEKVKGLEEATMQIVASLGVQQARRQHADFDEHVDEIKAVLEKYPGMDYSDAYLLAKSQKAGKIPPADQINTEKPGSTVTTPSGALTDKDMQVIANRGREARGEAKHGRVAFMEFVEEAADRVLSAHKE